MEQNTRIFGALLRELRQSLGLSQEQLSEKARISVDTVSALERGVNPAPQRETVARLALALDLSAEERRRLETVASQSRRRGVRATTPSRLASEPASPSPSNNLPLPDGKLIGRAATIAAVSDLVGSRRHVTLVGSGGIGKTSAALEVGRLLLPRFRDGVWFVDFAALEDGKDVAGKIAVPLGVPDSGDRPIQDILVDAIKGRNVLLILDTCEHVIDAAASLVEALYSAAPEVHVIATSREPLRNPGEAVFVLPPLNYPSREQLVNVSNIDDFGAMALFVERARSLDRNFEVTDELVPYVAQICRRLEGIALAIEMAAARVRSLNVVELAKRLEHILPTLGMGSRTKRTRQHTMQALIDWSYALLGDDERTLLHRLSIFCDGWTLDAAEAVCADTRLNSERVVAALAGLVDKSQVLARHRAGTTRYRLLDAVREFALEKWSAQGERQAIAARHAEWAASFCDALEEAGSKIWGDAYLELAAPELANIESALRWARNEGDVPTVAARIARPLFGVWLWTGQRPEARRVYVSILERLPSTGNETLASALWGWVSRLSTGDEALAAAQESVRLAECGSDPSSLAFALLNLGMAYNDSKKFDQALAACNRSLAAYEDIALTSSFVYGNALIARSEALVGLRQFEAARHDAHRLTEIMRGQEDVFWSALATIVLAEIESAINNFQSAIASAEDALTLLESHYRQGYAWLKLAGRDLLAELYLLTGELERAQDVIMTILEGTAYEKPASLARTTHNASVLAALRGDKRRAARLYGYSESRYRSERMPRDCDTSSQVLLDALQRQLDSADIERQMAEGARWDEKRAIREAFSACARSGEHQTAAPSSGP